MTVQITMTEFIDFVIRAGSPKLTVVRTVKERHAEGYHPMSDFYKKLRDGIVATHEQGLPKTNLDTILAGISDKNKVNTYPELVRAYKAFLGRKSLVWFKPPKPKWQHSGLIVNVNPELGLEINGTRHAVKLYFKPDQPSKIQLSTALHLLRMRISGMEVAILDVRRGLLHAHTGSLDPGVTALLEGEALAFERTYAAI